MVYDRGPFRHYGGHRAEHVRKRYQDRMKNYRSVLDEGMSAAPWVVSRLTEHVADAFLFMTRVSQARDLHDVLTAQSAFVQKKMDMFAGGAKVLTDVVAMQRKSRHGRRRLHRTRAMAQARRGHRTQFAQLRSEVEHAERGDTRLGGRVLDEDGQLARSTQERKGADAMEAHAHGRQTVRR